MPLPTNFRQNTFLFLGALTLGGATLGLLYYDYYLLRPHLSSIFWSFVAFAVLRKFRNPVSNFLRQFHDSLPTKLIIFIKIVISFIFLILLFQLFRGWSIFQN
jgi:hypothetical protein